MRRWIYLIVALVVVITAPADASLAHIAGLLTIALGLLYWLDQEYQRRGSDDDGEADAETA